MGGLLTTLGRAAASAWRRRRVRVGLQLLALAVMIGFLVYGVGDSWGEAEGAVRRADPTDLGLALLAIAAYYLAFVVGWQLILRAQGIRLGYRDTLRAEMLSMLAKYVPGGVWTPAARVVAVRRLGVSDTSLVLGSIALEAGLSAIAGVLVFGVSLTTVSSDGAPMWWLAAFAVVVAVLLHPRVFRPAFAYLSRPLGGGTVPTLPWTLVAGLLAYYCATWVLAGAGLYFLAASIGDPSATAIPYLGGASAAGAIVAVLAVFAPSGLGVRETATYGLLLAVVNPAVALGAVVLNRLAITLVEALLLLLVGVRGPNVLPEPDDASPEPSTA
jgi:glycosyltransferase 2 family protein